MKSINIKLIGLAIIFSLFTVACGDKKKNVNGPVAANPQTNQQIVNGLVAPNGSCPGCLQQPEFVLSGLGKSFVGGTFGTPSAPGPHRFELALDFYGELAMGADRTNAASACSYSGPIVAVGNFHVLDGSDSRLCGALPGQYKMVTSKVGAYSRGEGFAVAGRMADLTLQGTHVGTGRAIEIDVSLVQINGTCDVDAVRAEGLDGSFRFALQGGVFDSITIKSVNGQPCYDGVPGNGFWIE